MFSKFLKRWFNKEIKDIESNKCDDVTNLFIPDNAFLTPLHILIRESKFTAFLEIYDFYSEKNKELEKKLDNYISGNNTMSEEVMIIIQCFVERNDREEVTSYNEDMYTDLRGLVKIKKRNELSGLERSDLYLKIAYFSVTLEKLIKSFKIYNGDDIEQSDDDE